MVPVPEMVTQLLEVPKIIPQDRILQRTVKQAEATQVLQSETSGPDGQTYSSFQENSSAVLQTSTDLQGFEMVISVRRLAEQEHSTALDQLASRISAIMKFGAGADGDPFVKVKDLITDFISRLQAEPSSETNQKSYCDEEMSNATEKKEDLEADVAKHFSKLEAAVVRSVDLDDEISALQPANTQVQHVVNAVEAEMPKFVKETVQRKWPVINEKINQVTKQPEVPQVQVPHVQVVAETVDISQLQAVEKIVETRETQMIQSIQTSESSDTAPVRQVSQEGVAEVHPTDAKLKFLAEEALHGVGGFIFDANGNRVANMMGGQNCVTGEMWKNKSPFSPSLHNAISDDIAWQRKHYTGRGVRKLHESGTTLAEGMEALVSKMPDSIETHCQGSLKTAKDPDGEPYTVFARDKSWNEASGETGSEKNTTTTSVREQISQHSPSVSQSTWSPHPRSRMDMSSA